MSRWLVTGATGLLGANAMTTWGLDAVGVARRIPRSPVTGELLGRDISIAAERDGLVERVQPAAVLHAAAISTIEGCEADPAAAHELNVVASVDLAGQAHRSGARFVFISTDAVFDGQRGQYSEGDSPSPQSEYGRTKAEAEQRVLEANPDALVARVNFYGWSPSGTRSLAEFFWARLAAGQETPGFTDVHVSTTYVGDLITAIDDLVRVQASGIFHVVSPGAVSKFSFGRMLAEEFGFDAGLLVERSARDVLALPRGADLSLRTERLETALGHPLPDQRSGLRSLHADREAGLVDRLAALHP